MTLTEPPPVTQAVALALAELGECVCAELASSGGGPTCWCGLYPGQSVSWDYCGECSGERCGMGYVRLAGVFPYSSFPEPIIDDRCVRPLAWAVEVGALRCVPQPSDGGLLDATAMSEVAIIQVLDAAALHRAVKCCGIEVAIERYLPVGPQGGCVGGFWMAYLAVEVMATDVRVNIKDATIISALNTPGGAVAEWRNKREEQVLAGAFGASPVNDPDNANHRPLAPPPGTFKASWVTRRQGNRHRIGFQIENFADHAIYVEEGRSASLKFQQFSWTEWGGEIGSVGGLYGEGSGTRGRHGNHVLQRAVNLVGLVTGDWSPLA